LEFVKSLLETKLIYSIFDCLHKTNVSLKILIFSLSFLNAFIESAKKITLDNFIYLKIIEIVSAYLYTKNDRVFKTCLQILVILTGLESLTITNYILTNGVIPRILKFDKFLKDLEIDYTDVDLKKHLEEFPNKILILILKLLGNILADCENSTDNAEVILNKTKKKILKNRKKIKNKMSKT
jgi:hypothetical protein